MGTKGGRFGAACSAAAIFVMVAALSSACTHPEAEPAPTPSEPASAPFTGGALGQSSASATQPPRGRRVCRYRGRISRRRP